MKSIIRWKNTYSGEEGFVKKTSNKERCFYNTTDISEAKLYSTEAAAQKIIKKLEGFGQGSAICNEFRVMTVDR